MAAENLIFGNFSTVPVVGGESIAKKLESLRALVLLGERRWNGRVEADVGEVGVRHHHRGRMSTQGPLHGGTDHTRIELAVVGWKAVRAP